MATSSAWVFSISSVGLVWSSSVSTFYFLWLTGAGAFCLGLLPEERSYHQDNGVNNITYIFNKTSTCNMHTIPKKIRSKAVLRIYIIKHLPVLCMWSQNRLNLPGISEVAQRKIQHKDFMNMTPSLSISKFTVIIALLADNGTEILGYPPQPWAPVPSPTNTWDFPSSF